MMDFKLVSCIFQIVAISDVSAIISKIYNCFLGGISSNLLVIAISDSKHIRFAHYDKWSNQSSIVLNHRNHIKYKVIATVVYSC